MKKFCGFTMLYDEWEKKTAGITQPHYTNVSVHKISGINNFKHIYTCPTYFGPTSIKNGTCYTYNATEV